MSKNFCKTYTTTVQKFASEIKPPEGNHFWELMYPPLYNKKTNEVQYTWVRNVPSE